MMISDSVSAPANITKNRVRPKHRKRLLPIVYPHPFGDDASLRLGGGHYLPAVLAEHDVHGSWHLVGVSLASRGEFPAAFPDSSLSGSFERVAVVSRFTTTCEPWSAIGVLAGTS